MKEQLAMLETFHRVFRAHLEERPTAQIPEETIELRRRLIQEELDEYHQAACEHDLVGIADALSDLLYVVLGTYVSHGLQGVAEDLFAEVHSSNMSKLNAEGVPIHRADGKVLKSERFREPDLAGILDRVAERDGAAER